MGDSLSKKKNYLNQGITAPRVRLIDENGENKGIVETAAALNHAENCNLDLVQIVADASPPVCRVMDYGKYQFVQAKKAQQARRHQKQIQVKEVKFRPGTEQGDYQTKLRNLIRFLSAGDKAKVTVRFRGRELAYQERGILMLKRVEEDLVNYAVVEQEPKKEGRQMAMVLTPKKGGNKANGKANGANGKMNGKVNSEIIKNTTITKNGK